MYIIKLQKIFSFAILSFFISSVIVHAGGTITVEPGTPVTLSWKVENVADCTPTTNYPGGDGVQTTWLAGDGGTGKYASQGTKDIGAPTQIGTYSFVCTNGPDSDTVTLIVAGATCTNGATNAPTCTCDSIGANYHARDSDGQCVEDPSITSFGPIANPINYNTLTQLQLLGLTNAVSCTLAGPGYGSVGSPTIITPADDSFATPQLTSDATYTLVCNNGSTAPGAEKTWPAVVNVNPAPPGIPTIGNFSDDSPIAHNTPATLSWSGITDATSCEIDKGIGSIALTDGSISTPSLTIDTVYTLTCTGPGGTTPVQTTVDVTAPTSCSAGQFVSFGTCVPCTPGYHCDGTTAPVICPINTYCDGGNTPPGPTVKPPVSCPLGTGSPVGSTSAGACTAVSGSMTFSNTSCQIARNAASCYVNVDWNTPSPVSGAISAITRTNPTTDPLYTGNSGTNQRIYVYGTHMTTNVYLYNNAIELDNETITATCTGSDIWDGGSNRCIASVCSPGEYLNGGNCDPCPLGKTCDGNAAPVNCPANYYCPGSNTPIGGSNPPTACPGGTGSLAGSSNVGQCLAMTGTLNVSAASCTIPTGNSSCSVDVTWSTVGPLGTSAVTRTNPNGTVFSGNSGGPSPVSLTGEYSNVNFYLYNNSLELDNASVAVSCAAGANRWDSVSGECKNPSSGGVSTSGTYYSNPGSLDFTCVNSNGYHLYKDGVPLGGYEDVNYAGPYPLSIPITQTGNYGLVCRYGTALAGTSTAAYTTPPPPNAEIQINASPKTVSPGSKSSISWSVVYPTAACTFSAASVCSAGGCTSVQTASQEQLNTVITTQTTDANDPSGTRSILTSIKNLAPGENGTTWRALGKKTFTLTESTDFTIDCGAGKKASTRIRVAKSGEQ